MSESIVDEIWSHSKLKGSAKLLLLAIAHRAKLGGNGAEASLRDLQHITGLSLAQVCLLLKDLEARGYLIRQLKAGDNGKNRYTVLIPRPDPLPQHIEPAFLHAWQQEGYAIIYPLVPQYKLLEGKYRLDFAYPPVAVGIEIDDYGSHGTKTVFTLDRQRQRAIEGMGWRIIRFSEEELRQNISACIHETARFISRWEQ